MSASMISLSSTLNSEDGNETWIDEFLSDLEIHFQGCNDATKAHIKKVQSSVSGLKRALKRANVMKIAQEIQNGNIIAAAEMTKDFSITKLGTFEEIFKVAYGGNRGHLENIIEYVNSACPHEMKLACYKSIYDEMVFRKQTDDFQVIFLKQSVERYANDYTEQYHRFEQILCKLEDLITTRVANEVRNNDFHCFTSMTTIAKSAVVSVAKDIARKAFSATDCSFVPRILKMADYMMDVDDDIELLLILSIFSILQENSLLESSAAFHLWSAALVKDADADSDLDLTYFEALADKTPFYCQMYCKLIEDQDYATLKFWHNENTRLDQFMPDLLNFCVETNRVDTSKIIFALKKLENRSHCATGLLALYNTMVKNNLKETFCFFELFYDVKILMENVHYTDSNLEELKLKTPISIHSLLWNGGTNFKVINKFYGESLSFEEGNRRAITSPLKRVSDDQVWDIEIHSESHLAALKCETFDYGGGLFLHQAAETDEPCLMSGLDDNFIWKLIPADGEFIKISSLSGKFLAADQPKSGNNRNNALRFVYLKNEDNTSMQLWKLE